MPPADFGFLIGTLYVQGAMSLGLLANPATKKAVRETGKYVTVYAKQADGSWKIVDDISTPRSACR